MTSDKGPLLGWNVYTGTGHRADDFTFREFIPADDLDGKLEALTDHLVTEIGEAAT